MSEKITGQVARVLSDQEVVLNRGETHGLSVGDYVGIINSTDTLIYDPVTEDGIDSIKVFKVSLRVTQVSERLAIASTYRMRRVNRGGIGSAAALGDMKRFITEPKWVDEIERMRVAREEVEDGPNEVVSRGDEFIVVTKEVADAGYSL